MLSVIVLGLIATTITDVGFVILMALVGWAFLTVARTAKDMKASLPGIKLEVGQINRAVNHVALGEPTLIEQMRQLHRKVDSQNERWDLFAKSVGVRLGQLEDYAEAANSRDEMVDAKSTRHAELD